MPVVSGTLSVDGHPGIYAYQLKKGLPKNRTRYAAVVTVNRRQKWMRGFRTIKAAEEWADAYRVEMRTGQAGTAPARYILNDYLDNRWFPYIKTEVQPSTVEAYASCLKHIKRHLGERRLTSLTPLDIEDFKLAMAVEGLGQAAANGAFLRLKQSLAQAVTWRLLGNNPAGPIEAPRMKKYNATQLEPALVRRLLEAADSTTDYGALFWVACLTGLRLGEILALTWQDIDFAASELHVKASKTDAGVRTVAIGADTLERLQAHRLEQMRYAEAMGGRPPLRVFIRPKGDQLRDVWFYNKVWWPLRTRLALGDMHFHDLRHVHSSLMGKAKVHPSVMQARMGHTDAKLTLNVYTEADAEQQREAAAAIEGIVRLARS